MYQTAAAASIKKSVNISGVWRQQRRNQQQHGIKINSGGSENGEITSRR